MTKNVPNQLNQHPEASEFRYFQELKILGFRGFQHEGVVRFAIPNGKFGSGLTILVGSNNSGKSSVVEALQAFVGHQNPSFTQGRRNTRAGDEVRLSLQRGESLTTINSTRPGSSETEKLDQDLELVNKAIHVLGSRRAFNPFFGMDASSKESYIQSYTGLKNVRENSNDQFSSRLINAEKHYDEFNAVLGRVVSPAPEWTIDQFDTGQYFIKVKRSGSSHSSEGLGQGIISLLFIIDALYDSKPGQMIVIDEPELSLHPSLQKRLSVLLAEYASDRQIVLATHSPYFASINYLPAGATVIRSTSTDLDGTELHQLSSDTGVSLAGLSKDINNPHVLGLKAQEVMFLDDHPILFEGQEDVVLLSRVEESLGIKLDGEVFGWGVGGASKMEIIAQTLRELGFTKVAGILDGDKKATAIELQDKFPNFLFVSIPAKDIRTKQSRPAFAGTHGLLDESYSIRDEFRSDTFDLFTQVNEFLSSPDVRSSLDLAAEDGFTI